MMEMANTEPSEREQPPILKNQVAQPVVVKLVLYVYWFVDCSILMTGLIWIMRFQCSCPPIRYIICRNLLKAQGV